MARHEGVDLEVLFNQHVPHDCQRELFQALLQSYKQADAANQTLKLGEPEDAWLRPYTRRALFEREFRAIAGRYKLKARTEWTQGESMPYTVVQAGPFLLTESKVDNRWELPREAEFRKHNANYNWTMFDDIDPDPPAKKDPSYYAILTHVAHPSKPQPRSVNIVFPDGSYRRPAKAIYLMEQFADLVTEVPVPEEVVKPAEPRLKEGQKKRRKAE